MQNPTNPDSNESKLKQQIDLLLGDTDVLDKNSRDSGINIGNGSGRNGSSDSKADYESENTNRLARPPTSDDRSKLKTSRRLNPMENVPLLGIKGYNRDALGFVLLDGEVVEWISDDLIGTKTNNTTNSQGEGEREEMRERENPSSTKDTTKNTETIMNQTV